MSDILDRMRRVETTPLHGTEAWVELWEVLQDARAEIARLRLAICRLAEQDATLSVQGGNVIVEMDATLTDAEREAIGVAIQCVVAAKAQRHPEEEESHELLHKTAVTLRGLLERMK